MTRFLFPELRKSIFSINIHYCSKSALISGISRQLLQLKVTPLSLSKKLLLFTPTVLTVTESSLFIIRLRRKAGFLAILRFWHIA